MEYIKHEIDRVREETHRMRMQEAEKRRQAEQQKLDEERRKSQEDQRELEAEYEAKRRMNEWLEERWRKHPEEYGEHLRAIREKIQKQLEQDRRKEEERRRREGEGERPFDEAAQEFDGSEWESLPESRKDPLVLDLDGDGIETTDLSHGAFFDHDKNGLAELSSWVSKDDGLLVMDRNDDGIINDGGELFGDQTMLKSGLKASNGFEALAELDTNGDGKIDAQDQAFSRLRVWTDSNTDGYSSPEELHSLEELDIASINLQSEVVNMLDVAFNITQRVGAFEKVDGSTQQIAEYGFYQETTYTLTNEWRVVPEDVSAMPILWGYGNVYDLHQAIVRDETGELKALVGAFATVTDPAALDSFMEQILFKWAGTDRLPLDTSIPASVAALDTGGQSGGSVTAGGMYNPGASIDDRKLAVLEHFFGQAWVGANGSRRPGPEASIILNEAYRGIFEYMYAQLMIQTHLQHVMGTVVWSTDPETGVLQIDNASVGAMLNHLLTNAIDNPEQGRLILSEFSRTLRGLGWKNTPGYLSIREFFIQQDPSLAWVFDTGGLPVYDQLGQSPDGWYLPHMFGTWGSDAVQGSLTAGDGYINGLSGNDVIFGTDRNERLFNQWGDALLYGGGGNDIIYAGEGNDILDGGTGNDILYGETGNDTYIFRRNSGQDFIVDADATAGNIDTIWLGSSLTPDEIVLRRGGDNLVLKIIGTTDTLTVKDFFRTTTTLNRIEQIQFMDGTVWTDTDIIAKTYATSEDDDVIYGGSGDDTLSALGGNDTVFGRTGDDALDGGTGSDRLYGEEGNDTLLGGDGSDTLLGGCRDTGCI